MRKLMIILLFFFITLTSCVDQFIAPEFADNYGDTWERVAYRCGNETTEANLTAAPGDNIQHIVNKGKPGDVIFLIPGTYRKQSIRPKSGMLFVATDPATGDTTHLHGKNETEYAFYGNADNVGICNLLISNYSPGPQMGAIKAGDHDATLNTKGWVVKNVEIRNNHGGGIRAGSHMKILGGSIHDNSQIGIAGGGVINVLIKGVEIYRQNIDKEYDYTWEAGGIKFTETDSLTVQNSFIHNNFGPGVWGDINSRGFLIEDNVIEDNAGTGVFQEISGSATIRRNTLRRNGYDLLEQDGPYGAGIQIAASDSVKIYENILVDNKNGIIGIQQKRMDWGGPHLLDNLEVYNNLIVQQHVDDWAAGVFSDVEGEVFDRNIRFDHNTYILSSQKRSFRWSHHSGDWDHWNDSGHDQSGVLKQGN